jgi:D-arabinose 1-dehydrogenase-like Zn-dependent alcohol dehydrogenase
MRFALSVRLYAAFVATVLGHEVPHIRRQKQRLSIFHGRKCLLIETMPLERAPEAYAKMMAGNARFRMVLTMV